jgi:hypothetical protein
MKVRLLGGVAIAGLLVTGCGGGSGKATTPSPSPSPVSTSSPDPALLQKDARLVAALAGLSPADHVNFCRAVDVDAYATARYLVAKLSGDFDSADTAWVAVELVTECKK